MVEDAEPAVSTADQARRTIEIVNPKLSPVRREMLAVMLAGIAEQVFTDREHRAYWFALLAVESGYVGTAKSHVGAVGLGQLMPQYAKAFGASCGYTDLETADLYDDYTNATLSACFLRELLVEYGGSMPLALTAYNAGQYSHGIKQAKVNGAPSVETSKYVTRIWLTKNSQQPKE